MLKKMLKKIWYFLTFKTYGSNLLDSDGAKHLSAIAVIVSLAALSEGFAWGHFGSSFTPDNPILGRAALGIFVFLLFWFFDRTMITQDMMGEEHAKVLEGEEYDSKEKKNTFIFLVQLIKKNKSIFIFAIRLVIVVVSLRITAPFLTQLVFKADIEKEIQVQYQDSIEKAKEETLGKIEQKISEQENHVREINEKLQQELSGKRGTGYGKGVVAQSIEAELAAASAEFEQLKEQLANTKTRLDNAIIQDDTKTLESFGIFIVKDSPLFRANSIQKLKTQPAFQNIEWGVNGFLILLGVILILSKLLQPYSLKMYYSSRLQEAWRNYKEGNYDDYLLENEKSTRIPTDPMPQTFEKIAIHYAQTKNQRLKDDAEHKEKIKQAALQAELEQQKLKESEKAYDEHHAKELQNSSYEFKVTGEKKERVGNALDQTRDYKQRLMQEKHLDKQLLEDRKNQVEQELFEVKRIYESQYEDAMARQKRMENEQSKLLELQQIANEREQKDKSNVENVKSFIAVQDAIEDQKQKIKNMQDNHLTFERDMNIHKEKVDNLESELGRIIVQTQAINEEIARLDENIAVLEWDKIKFFTDIAKNSPTIYAKGDDIELGCMIKKIKENNGVYEFTHFNNNSKTNR